MINPPNPLWNYGEQFKPLIASITGIPGAVAEFGVYKGGTSRQLAEITGRTVYAFDTFEGIPKEDYNKDLDHDEPGKFNPEYSVEELFRECPSIVPVKGRFIDTLPNVDPTIKFAFVYIDCDLYSSAKQVLDWLPERLVSGAVVFFDDYGSHKGIRKAVDEFTTTYADNLEVVRGSHSSLYFTWKKE